MERPSQTLLTALLVVALVVGSLSGLGLVLAAVGFARERSWRQGWGIWLPTAFGLSVAVGVISFVLLLLSGIVLGSQTGTLAEGRRGATGRLARAAIHAART